MEGQLSQLYKQYGAGRIPDDSTANSMKDLLGLKAGLLKQMKSKLEGKGELDSQEKKNLAQLTKDLDRTCIAIIGSQSTF